MNTQNASKWVSLSLAFVIAGFAQSVSAQVEEIVVVGARGEGRDPLESMVPVDVITAEDMQRVATLGGELGELLQALSPSFSFPRQSNSGSVDHIRPAQLRGLSPDQVLVLVNGKRQHTTAVVNLEAAIGLGSTAFDFNTIPLIAIKRIEILRDGAAAQYGSDAIAGVINIVLKDAAEGGSLTASYGSHSTDVKPTGKSLSDGETIAVAADYGISVGESGSFRFGFDYRDRSSTSRGGVGALPFFEDQTPANQALDNSLLFAPGDGDAEDFLLYYNASLAAGNNEFYSFGRFNQRDAEGTAFFRYPDGFSGVPSVYPEGYRPITTGDSNDLSISVGLRGEVDNTNWDLSITIGQNDYEFGVRNSINPSFGAASPTKFNLAGFEFLQSVINADAVTLFDRGGAGPLSLAYGVEVRIEDYKTEAGDPESYLEGPFSATAAIGAEAGPGLDADSVADVDRRVFAVYGDLEIPVSDAVTVGIAGRYEDYDDFGDAFTGKLSARAELTDAIAIRATFGTSFRGPSLAQTAFQFSTQNFGGGGMLETFGHLPVSDPLAIANGAIPLNEEESDNISVGIVFDRGEQFTITVDYFKVDIDDRITLVNGSTDNVTFFSNLVDTETDGFDIMARGSLGAGSGTLNWSAAYNTSDTEVQNPSVLGEEELNILETAAPDDKVILQGDWDGDRWGFLLRATRFGETTRDFDFGGGFPDAQVHDAKWSIDIEAAYQVNDAWIVAIGADNVTDEYSELSSDDNNFFGHLPYDVLSGIGFNGAYWYARTNYNFK